MQDGFVVWNLGMRFPLLALTLCLVASTAGAADIRQPVRPAAAPAAATSPVPDAAADASSKPVLEFDPSGPEHWRAKEAWTMRANPTRTAKVLGQVKAGEEVTVLGRVSGTSWYALVQNSGVVTFVEVPNPPVSLAAAAATCPIGPAR